ncbi:MAG: VCBS repeat-containing protein [Candidatus Rokubacteria bacterium]|nr:VCBS repeat-containing protein [Candidatus Rokubacteria bacterium]
MIRSAVRATAWFAAALFFLAGATGLARGQAEPLPFKLLAEQLVALFPEVVADVVEVQGGKVTISVGRRGGLQPGVQMVLFREGRELRHPKSGEVLGRVEEQRGRVVVDETFDTYSTASVIEGSGARPGDKVRVSAGKIKLTVLKLVSGLKEDLAEAAVRAVVEELGRTGRFQVEFGDRVSVWLSQRAVTDQEFLAGTGVREALERFRIGHLLVLGFSKVGKRPYMEVRLFSGLRAESVLTTSLFVPPSVKPPVARQYSSTADARTPAPRAQQGSLLARMLGWNRDPGTYSAGAESMPVREVARFGFAVRTMDVAVAPADGIARLVLADDGGKIFLYRLVGQTLEPEWAYERRSIGRILSLQLADLDGDGSLEVVVNRQDPGVGMLSQVIAARNGQPEPVAQDIPLILLAVDEKGEGVKRGLWGQMYSRDKMFTPGHAERLVLKDGELTSAGRVPVPHAFRATGATLSNIADKSLRALVFVDAEQRLQIAVHGEERWRSAIAVGGGYTLGEIQEGLSGMITSRYFKMEPSPVAVDLDQDGVEEIVVPVNQGESGLLAVVFRGPAGYRIQVVNAGLQGAITSIGVASSRENTPSLVASLVRFTGILQRSGETQIIMTIPE